MFCKYCGKEQKDGSKFCSGCGASLSGTSGNTVNSTIPKVEISKENIPVQTNNGNNAKAFLPIVVFLLLFVAVGTGVFFFLNNKSANDTVKKPDTEDLSDKTEENTDDTETTEMEETDDAEVTDSDKTEEPKDLEKIDYDAVFKDFVNNQEFLGADSSFQINAKYDDFWKFEFDMPEGYLNSTIRDFDKDGDPELLMVGYQGNQTISLEIYEADESGTKLNASTQIDDCLFPLGAGVTDIYVYNKDQIMLESSKWGSLVADGGEYYFTSLSYDGDKLYKVAQKYCAGSDIQDNDEYIDALSDAGIDADWSPLFERRKMISDYTNVSDTLARLKECYKTSAKKANKAIDSGKSIKFAELTFYKDFDSAIYDDSRVDESDSDDDYILADSDRKKLDEDDLDGLSKEECKLARNELYARHGRKFDDEGIRSYFESKDWYDGYIDPDDFSESMLSEIEMYNRDLIVEYEKDHGYR